MRLDTYYLNIAETASSRSKCVSLKVGCVLVLNDKVVSTGLNGTGRGDINCNERFPDGNCPEHHEWSQEHEIHAEMNAILQAERSLVGAWAFTTTSPCANCLKHLLAAGVERIYYRHLYKHFTQEGINDLKERCLKRKTPVYLFKEGDDDSLNHE